MSIMRRSDHVIAGSSSTDDSQSDEGKAYDKA